MAELLILGQQQIVDEVGRLAEVVQSTAGEGLYVPDIQGIPSPGYAVACALFEQDASRPHFAVSPADGRLAEISGLRALVGVQTQPPDSKQVFLPGIVRPDNHKRAQFACLSTDFVEPPLDKHLQRPLSDMQQALLEAAWSMQDPNGARHVRNEQMVTEQVNMGNIAHAAVIGTIGPEELTNLHTAIHAFATAGLARSLAGRQALTMHYGVNGQNKRDSKPIIVPAREASHIIIAREHQMPSSFGLDATAMGVGLPMAAVSSQKAFRPQPNLRLNTQLVIAEQVDGDGSGSR